MLHPTPLRKVVLFVLLLALLSVSQPGIVVAGSNVWTSIGPEGGTINSLAIDPKTPMTLYAGTGGWGDAGVFKSTNGGGTWSAVNTGLADGDINALVIDSITPTTLYAGIWGGACSRARMAAEVGARLILA